jgi:hypothetical protein
LRTNFLKESQKSEKWSVEEDRSVSWSKQMGRYVLENTNLKTRVHRLLFTCYGYIKVVSSAFPFWHKAQQYFLFLPFIPVLLLTTEPNIYPAEFTRGQ